MKALLFAGLAVAVGGCATFRPQVLADGSYRLKCSSTLAQCIHRAKKYCGDEGLKILRRSDDELYGVEGHQVGAEGAEVHFRCGQEEEPEWKLPPRRGTAPRPQAGKPKRARVCTPGVTQRCVGPGACEGGQACLPDGSGFGPCDCGPAADAPSDAPIGDAGAGDGKTGDAAAGAPEPEPTAK